MFYHGSFAADHVYHAVFGKHCYKLWRQLTTCIEGMSPSLCPQQPAINSVKMYMTIE